MHIHKSQQTIDTTNKQGDNRHKMRYTTGLDGTVLSNYIWDADMNVIDLLLSNKCIYAIQQGNVGSGTWWWGQAERNDPTSGMNNLMVVSTILIDCNGRHSQGGRVSVHNSTKSHCHCGITMMIHVLWSMHSICVLTNPLSIATTLGAKIPCKPSECVFLHFVCWGFIEPSRVVICLMSKSAISCCSLSLVSIIGRVTAAMEGILVHIG